MYRQTQAPFQETSEQADWGYWYWATDAVTGLSFQAGPDFDVRKQFSKTGVLKNTMDTNYRAINKDWPVAGLSVDLGNVQDTIVSTTFSLGLCQEQAVRFAGAGGITSLPSLWTSYFSSDLDPVDVIPAACTSLRLQHRFQNNNPS